MTWRANGAVRDIGQPSISNEEQEVVEPLDGRHVHAGSGTSGRCPLGSREDFAIRWRVDEAAARRTLDRLENEGLVDHVYRGQHPTPAESLLDDSRRGRTSFTTPAMSTLRWTIFNESRGCGKRETTRQSCKCLSGCSPGTHAHGPFGDTEDHKHAPWSATIAGIREIFTRLALAEQVYPIAPDLLLSDHIILPFELPARGQGYGAHRNQMATVGPAVPHVARSVRRTTGGWHSPNVGVHAKGTVIRDKYASRFDGLGQILLAT